MCKLRIRPDTAKPVVAGEVFTGVIQAVANHRASLDALSIQPGKGWTSVSLGAPEAMRLEPGVVQEIAFQAIPDQPLTTLPVVFQLDGRVIRKRLRVSEPDRPNDAARTGDSDGGGSGPRGNRLITFRGRLAYPYPDPNGVYPDPSGRHGGVDRAFYEIWDYESFPGFDRLIDEGYTNEDGTFEAIAYWDHDDDPDVYFHAYSVNDDVDAQELTLAGFVDYDITTEDQPITVPGDELDFDLALGGDILAPDEETAQAFHILTTLSQAHRWIAQTASVVNLPNVTFDFPTVFPSPVPFSVVADPCAFTAFPGDDGWSTGTIIHEYGHHFMYHNSSYFPSPLAPPYCDPDGHGDETPVNIPICPLLGLLNPLLPFLCHICGDPQIGCGHTTWCTENEIVAWQEGVPNWIEDAVSRELRAQAMVDLSDRFEVPPNLGDTFENITSCGVDGLIGDPRITEGIVAALLRDMDDPVEDSTSCSGDAMSLEADGEMRLIFRVLRDEQPENVVQFIDIFRAKYPEYAGRLWRTARAIGGDLYVQPAEDTQPPGPVETLWSNTHPLGVGGNWPVITVEWDRPQDDASGPTGYSTMWGPAPVDPDQFAEIDADVAEFKSPPLQLGEYWFSIRARDCAGHWGPPSSFGPFEVTECNTNGILDVCETRCNYSDADIPPWFCALSAGCGTTPDCNTNAVPDECDIEGGTSSDCNANAVPDECESIVYWVGLASSNWSDGANWSTGAPPGPADHACISAPGIYAVVLDVSPTVGDLGLGGPGGPQTLDMLSRTLTLAGPAASTVNANGVVRARGGSNVNNAGPLVVNPGGKIQVEGSFNGANARLTVANGLTNAGVIELTNTVGARNSILAVTNGALINHGTIDVLSLPGGGGNGHTLQALVDNHGTINIVTAACAISKVGAPHVNRAAGKINISGEDLTISQSGAATFSNHGTIDIAAGRMLHTRSGTTFNQQAGGAVTGPGTLKLELSTVNFTPDFSNAVTELVLSSSTVNGPGTLTNVGWRTLTLDRSAINAPFVNQGVLVIWGGCGIGAPAGLFDHVSGATIRVEGRGGIGAGGLTVTNGFSNAGLIELTNSAGGLSAGLSMTNGTLVNQNSITVSTGMGGGLRTLAAQIDNRGTMDINHACTISGASFQHVNSAAGTINVVGGNLSMTTASAAFTNGGAMNVGPGRTLAFTQGTFVQTGGITSLDGGVITKTGSAIAIQGGVVRGNGSITGGVINSGGVVAPGLSPGLLAVTGTQTQTAGGTLQIELGGTAPGSEYDRLSVTGTAPLAGTLEVALINGFVPAVGQEFVILQAGSLTGTFANVQPLTPGLEVNAIYGPTSVTLEVTGTPIVGDCDFDGDVDGVDMDEFGGCMTGPDAGPVPAECECADLDRDGDSDLADWSELQVSF